jgi:acyl carrier protein
MKPFAIEDLYAIMADVFNQPNFKFEPTMSAKDVPAWDSLAHSVLMMEIFNATGADLPPDEAARAPDIAALHAAVVERIPSQ